MTIKVDIKHIDVKAEDDPVLFVAVTGQGVRKFRQGMGESLYVAEGQDIHIFKNRRKKERRET